MCINIEIKPGQEIRFCTPYFATPGEQYSKKSMKISTISPFFLFTLAVHSFKDQTWAEIISFPTYCATSFNQLLKQSTKIITINTYFLFTVAFHSSRYDTRS